VASDAETADAALAASGDGRAFERLYRTHVARVHGLARRMMGSEHADDVTQDVFVRAWTKLSTFRGEAAFGTWLHRLAINVILARRTTLGAERGRYDASEAALETVASRPARPELSMDFEEAIGRLPDGARQVFVLHDLEGYKHEEIGGILGKEHIRRAVLAFFQDGCRQFRSSGVTNLYVYAGGLAELVNYWLN